MSGHDPRDDYDDAPVTVRLAPKDLVRLPSSIMWVFGLLQLIITQLGVAVILGEYAISLADGRTSLGEIWDSEKERTAILATAVAWIVGTTCTIIVMRGANDLRRFRRYPWVLAASALTILALPFFYLAVIQLPLGLWVLFLLLRRDVRARFEAAARGTINQSHPGPIDRP